MPISCFLSTLHLSFKRKGKCIPATEELELRCCVDRFGGVFHGRCFPANKPKDLRFWSGPTHAHSRFVRSGDEHTLLHSAICQSLINVSFIIREILMGAPTFLIFTDITGSDS